MTQVLHQDTGLSLHLPYKEQIPQGRNVTLLGNTDGTVEYSRAEMGSALERIPPYYAQILSGPFPDTLFQLSNRCQIGIIHFQETFYGYSRRKYQ